MYLTLAQLVASPGALELAQVASDKHGALVDAALLELTLLDGEPDDEIDEDDIAAAARARARIEQAMTEADAVIDGYLGRRYTLPLAAPHAIISTWARAIVRYKLHGDRLSVETSDPVVRDYRDAIKFLEQIAAGKFSLGIEDPTVQGEGEVRIEPGSKVFGREFLP